MTETIKNAGGELSGTLSGDTPLEKKIKTIEELDEMIAKYQKLADDMRATNNHSKSDLEFAEETLERLINEKESRQQIGQ